jgi:CheY-like chemotaxis protein
VSLDDPLRLFRQGLVEAATVEQVASAPPAQPEAGTGQRPLRLLAAEDNKTNQVIFRKMLKGLTLDLTLVGDGQQALDSYLSARPDMLFTDISMPGMDGLDLTRRIRAHEAETGLPRLPIVAMTAHAMEDHEAEILAAGVDHYLTKPLKKAAILEKMAGLAPSGVLPLAPG